MEERDGRQVVVHKVEKGETLYSLSRRYQASVEEIIAYNKIENNTLSLDQILFIPTALKTSEPIGIPQVEKELDTAQVEDSVRTHVVQAKETLYRISKMYDVSMKELKSLNGLTGNALSLGQVLKLPTTKAVPEKQKDEEVKETVLPGGFKEYLVQSGDMLETIAKKYSVRPDSIIIWNQLSNTYLAIGQRLLIKGEIDSLLQMQKPKVEETGYSQKSKVVDASGFNKVIEEGIVKQIENVIETDKYLAMHRTLKIGTMVEVRNLMNNKRIFVRVVGKLPSTGLNENTLIRLTPICFERLGVIDPKARVEISYYED
ncbi:MAG: LysM peptidoglycan-binding domain-containing protein [Cyclobacteriaceae bacterium]